MKTKFSLILFAFYFIANVAVYSQAILNVSPLLLDKEYTASTDTFFVSNTGSDTLFWEAVVSPSDTSWLSITSNNSGTDNGFFIVTILANSDTLRTGTISVSAQGISIPQIVEVVQHNRPYPDWQYNITGASHSILIQTSTELLIDTVPLSNGDYVGVFTEDTTGDLICAGYIEYTGSATVIIAWEDDAFTPEKDGFVAGDTFNWKLWRASDGYEFPATATYLPLFASITSQENYESGGMSGLQSLTTEFSQTQTIIIPGGWSMFSSFIIPDNPEIPILFSDNTNNIAIVKNGLGQVYWPAFGLNLIGSLVNQDGYQVKALSSDTLKITGTKISPEGFPVYLPTGWSLKAYLRDNPGDVEIMFAPVSNNTILVKNYLGQVYWLAFGLNLLGNMIPGQGYQIKMLAQDTLYYPAN